MKIQFPDGAIDVSEETIKEIRTFDVEEGWDELTVPMGSKDTFDKLLKDDFGDLDRFFEYVDMADYLHWDTKLDSLATVYLDREIWKSLPNDTPPFSFMYVYGLGTFWMNEGELCKFEGPENPYPKSYGAFLVYVSKRCRSVHDCMRWNAYLTANLRPHLETPYDFYRTGGTRSIEDDVFVSMLKFDIMHSFVQFKDQANSFVQFKDRDVQFFRKS